MSEENQLVKNPIVVVADMLKSQKDQLKAALPATYPWENFIRSVKTYLNMNPDVLKADPLSICKSVLASAQLGLAPDGLLGSAYLVRYGTDCQLIIGWRGLVDLARKNNYEVEAEIVREADHFKLTKGLDRTLEHEPDTINSTSPICGAYAIAWPKDGGRPKFEYMTLADLEGSRNSSQTGRKGTGPWKDHYGEMCRKSVIRRLCKYLPLSPDAHSKLATDAKLEAGDEIVLDVSAAVSEPRKSDALAAELAAEAEAEPVVGKPMNRPKKRKTETEDEFLSRKLDYKRQQAKVYDAKQAEAAEPEPEKVVDVEAEVAEPKGLTDAEKEAIDADERAAAMDDWAKKAPADTAVAH